MPQITLRHGGRHVYLLLGYRVDETHTAGMQANAPVGIAARRAVLQVSLNRATHLGQLATDLMVTAGFEVYFQKEITFRTADKLIVENGFLCPGLFLVVSIRLVLPRTGNSP